MSPAGSASTDKAESVKRMFSEIAPTYDLLNSVLSLGVDGLWRRDAARAALGTAADMPGAGRPDMPVTAAPHYEVLDVATGTGMLALTLKRLCGACRVVGVDFAEPMLDVGRKAAARLGADIEFEVADGTALPHPAGSFDAVTIAYGLRNFVDPDAGLREFMRVLRPGGRLVVLEFPPPPAGPLGRLFRAYFTRILPRLGGAISGRRSAYAYLPESVLSFMPPEELAARMRAAGFEQVSYRLQTFGISAMHVGTAPRPASAQRADGPTLGAAVQP